MEKDSEENLISDFYSKCAKLNVPVSVLPDEQFLKRIFRTNNSSLLHNFLKKVDTKQEIARIRSINLYQKVKDINTNQISNFNALPDELKTYIKDQRVRKQIRKEEEENEALRHKERQLLEQIKKNDVKKRLLKKQVGLQKTKSDILNLLSNHFDDEIKMEEEDAEKNKKDYETIKGNNVQEEAANRIEKTIAILSEFSSRGISTSGAKEKCVNEIEKQIYPVPSTMIFDILLKSLQSKAEDAIFTTHYTKLPSPTFEQMLEGFKELKINLWFEKAAMNIKVQNAKQLCTSKIEEAETYLDELYFDDDDDEDIVGELIAALTGKLVVEGKFNFVKQRIEEIRSKIAHEESTDIGNVKLNIQNTNQMIADRIASIQIDFAKMHHINERYKHANMKTMRAVNNLKLEKHQEINRILLSQTVNNTTLDKSTLVDPAAGLGQEELDLFLKMPMKGEEIINLELETLLASSPVTQIFTQNLSKFMKILKSLHMQMILLQESSMEMSSSINVATIINEEFINEIGNMRRENCKEITSMFDNIIKRNVDLRSLLRNIELIFKFIMENPLKKFMDPQRKYENKTFAEYENEFMLYYRMIDFGI